MSHSRHAISVLMVGAIALISSNAPCNTNVLLYNFNDGNFAGWTVNSGTWTVTNGTLMGHRNAGTGLDAYIYTGDTNWSDFVFETDAVFQDGSAILMFRSTGHWTNEYRLGLYSQVAEAYSNRFHLMEYNNGVVTVDNLSLPNIVDGNAMSPVPIPENARIKVEAVGSLLSFYINDALMWQFIDPTPIENGRIGLGTIWNWTDAFDNVSVTLVPEPSFLWALVPTGVLTIAIRRARRHLNRTNQPPVA